jgi:hypothetical protein
MQCVPFFVLKAISGKKNYNVEGVCGLLAKGNETIID